MVCVGPRITTYQTNHTTIKFFSPKITYFRNIEIGFPSNPNDYIETRDSSYYVQSLVSDLVEGAFSRAEMGTGRLRRAV